MAFPRIATPEYRAYKRDYFKRPVVAAQRRVAWNTWNNSLYGRASVMLSNARQNAKRVGVDCTLSKEWIIEQLKAGVCSVTGIPFEFLSGHGKQHPWSPSLDRTDYTQGYTPENTRVVCWMFNRARGDYGDAALNRLVEALASRSVKC